MAITWRFRTLDTFHVPEATTDGISGRTKQIILPLLAVADHLGPPCRQRYQEDLLAFARQRDAEVREVRRESWEAQLIEAYVALPGKENGPTCQALADIVTNGTDADANMHRALTARKVSEIMRGMGFKTKHTNRGSVVMINENRLRELCKRFGIVTEQSPPPSPAE